MSDIFGQVPQDEPPLPQLVEDLGEQHEQVATSFHRSNSGAGMSSNHDEAAQMSGVDEGPDATGDDPPLGPVEEAHNSPPAAGDVVVTAHEDMPPDENSDEAGELREP